MPSLKKLAELIKRVPSDLMGVDVGKTAIKAARMVKSESGPTLVSAAIVPRSAAAGDDKQAAPPVFPPRLRSRYVSLAVSAPEAVVKLLGFPGAFDAEAEAKIADSMGIENPDSYRIGYKLIAESKGKIETKVLAVAIPETDVQAGLGLFPSGLPAPFSLEVAGLATLTAFAHGPLSQHGDKAVGLVDFGADTTTLSLFNGGILAIIRRFNTGTDALLSRVRETLGVDEETAKGIVADGAFDISQAIGEALDEVVKQLVISRDFVERRENCHIVRIYVSGSQSVLRHCLDDMAAATGVEVVFWNPLEGLRLSQGALPEGLAGQEWCLSAAVGACLATLESA
jgi:Tfp pilus assembly PilM family ATPase